MFAKIKILFLLSAAILLGGGKCAEEDQTQGNPSGTIPPESVSSSREVIVGAQRLDLYLPKIKNLEVALLVNQTSTVGDEHLVDVLLAEGISIKKIFSPEHGFRGDADAGEHVSDGKDAKTGIPVISIYGSKKKPDPEDLDGIDMVIFDVQDVGARFYTYIYTMSYVMEACAENEVRFLVLDRPNPNGHYVDGPLLKKGFESFVGLHPTPVVHGMTTGEYARMVNGEGWLKNGLKCKLEVIDCQHYTHQSFYTVPVKPSPNLPNMKSIYLYPSICFFEGTVASVGRGTDKQFQVLGHPDFPDGDFYFTPVPMPGAKSPKLEGQRCRGYDLSTYELEELRKKKFDLSHLINFYQNYPDQKNFFLQNKAIERLWGSDELKQWLSEGWTAEQIRATWEENVKQFKKVRKKYLLYQDFE